MKKLMILLLIAIALVFSGCEMICPEEEVIPVEEASPILFPGCYSTRFDAWRGHGWADCEYFAPAGIYWTNYADGRMFFISELPELHYPCDACDDGDCFIKPDPIKDFGSPPAFFEWELIVEKYVEDCDECE